MMHITTTKNATLSGYRLVFGRLCRGGTARLNELRGEALSSEMFRSSEEPPDNLGRRMEMGGNGLFFEAECFNFCSG